MWKLNNQLKQLLIHYKFYVGMIIYHEQESRIHTHLKTNQPYKHLFRDMNHSEIVHGINQILNVYEYNVKTTALNNITTAILVTSNVVSSYTCLFTSASYYFMIYVLQVTVTNLLSISRELVVLPLGR